jgi:hypothetical protein
MEFGGIFILVILLIVLAVLGGGSYALTVFLRAKQFDPERDEVERPRQDGARPEHLEAGDAQRARLVGTR